MPRAKGKVNYKVATLIEVVEEKLPNGAPGWREVAALYQNRSRELILRDYEDVKRHWVEKCCNSFKNPTGDPGDPKRDMILKCQKIQGKIMAKTAYSMGIASGEEEGDADEEVAGLASGLASRGSSRGGSPVGLDAAVEEEIAVINGEDVVAVPSVPPLQGLPTQQSAEEIPGVHPDFPRLTFPPQKLQHIEEQQEVQQPQIASKAAAKKKVRKSMESSPYNERIKNSISEKRGSIVKPTDRSSITTDETNCSAAAASLIPMIMMLQSQVQMQHAMMQKEIETHMQGQTQLLKRILKEMKRKERKEKKDKKKARKKRKVAAAGTEKMEVDSSSSSGSSSSSISSSGGGSIFEL
jgi:hypothetical protein